MRLIDADAPIVLNKECEQTEKTLINVSKGQDAYSVIGDYILNHVTAIEDMIAVIQVNGVIMKELYMVAMNSDGYYYWNNDWWEGESDVALLDFFPVSDAERPLVRQERKAGEWIEHGWAEDINGMLISNFECTCCYSWVREKSNFCPNCGAYMGGDTDG